MLTTALFNLAIIALAVYLLAIITDEYFVASLDQISQRLKLPHSVAGASLMAVGSSAPELAIALLALFTGGGEHSDVGIGTIVGSAVFNVLVITGASAMVRPVQVTWRVVVRDVVMYVACIALLLATFQDGRIVPLEALAYLALYGVYLYILLNWESMVPGTEEDVIELMEQEIAEERVRAGLYFRVTNAISRGIGLFTGNPHNGYLRAFLVSILLIVGLSYALIQAGVAFAGALGVPPVIVALTILAGGTSVPDMFASVVVARQGRGEMAVANAVGSNIFDILIGLGLPWLLAMAFRGEAVLVGTAGLWQSTLILLGTVLLLFLFLTTGQRLSRGEGFALVAVYIGYVVWAYANGG